MAGNETIYDRLIRLEDDVHGDAGSPGIKSELAALRTRVTWGFVVLGAAVAAPKLGTPTVPEAISALISYLT